MNAIILNQIGNTPLIQFNGSVLNNNRIWLKLECNNPYGSHYDRVYRMLFDHFEKKGLLKPGATVLETTSGTAGVSFAAIGRELGYKCLVAIPEGGEHAREEAIKHEGAELIFTPAKDYVNAFPRFVGRYLVQHRDVVFLNHSMGPNFTENETTVSALSEIGHELLQQLDQIDCFIAAVGNGSSILGPGRVLKDKSRIITFEPFQSAVAYDMMYHGRYEEIFGIKPGTLPRHGLPGASYRSVDRAIDFPHIRLAFRDEHLVSETLLISDKRMDSQYQDITSKQTTATLPHWDAIEAPYGRTTRAGIAVALKIAEQVSGQNLVVLAYDKPNRYDS